MGYKPNIMEADVFIAHIIFNDGGPITKEYKIKDCWDIRFMLCSLKFGQEINIKGLGKLKVMHTIEHDSHDNEYDLRYHELMLSCRKIGEYEEKQETAIVPYIPFSFDEIKERMQRVMDADYKRTWG